MPQYRVLETILVSMPNFKKSTQLTELIQQAALKQFSLGFKSLKNNKSRLTHCERTCFSYH